MIGRTPLRLLAFLLLGVLVVAGGRMLADTIRRIQVHSLQEDVDREPDGGSYVVRP